jgi:carbonic anhydrase
VKAAIDEKSNPGNTISNWIQGIVKEYEANRNELDSILDRQVKENRMIEYHLMAQMKNLSKLNVIRNAVEKFGFPKLHAWIYDIHTGHVKVIAENYNEEKV